MAAVAPTVTVTPSQLTITNVQALLAVILVAGSGAVPTGSVVLASTGWTSGAAKLVNGQASVTVPPGVLALGSATLTATYTPDAGSTAAYTTGTGTATETIVAVPTALPSKLAGYKAQLFVNSAGSSWLIAGLKDLEGGFKIEQLDATDHSNNGWKSRIPGLLDFEGTAKLDYIEGDASQKMLLNAVLNSTVLNITILPIDSAASGANSFVGTAMITDFKWDGKNTDLQGVQLTLTGAGPFSVVAQ